MAGEGDGREAPCVHINMDGSVQSCTLYVYTVSFPVRNYISNHVANNYAFTHSFWL